MMVFEEELKNIYRLKVPFEDIYTSIFFIRTKRANLLVDTATFNSDIDEYLLPALDTLVIKLTDIAYLILTHLHSDHAGGVNRIRELNPKIEIVRGVAEKLPNGVSGYELKGLTLDLIGVFDEDTGTLITGDGLQGVSVGKYRLSLESKDEYIKTLAKIQADARIQNILLSHAYEPWGKDGAFGREQVEQIINDCRIIIGERQ